MPRAQHPDIQDDVQHLYVAIETRATALASIPARRTSDEEEALRYALVISGRILAQRSAVRAKPGASVVTSAGPSAGAEGGLQGAGATGLRDEEESEEVGAPAAAPGYYCADAEQTDDGIMDDREVALKM